MTEQNLGPCTQNLERTLLSAFFAWAIEHGLHRENPARTLTPADRGTQNPQRVLDADEVDRLLTACREAYEVRCVGFRNRGGPAGGVKTTTPRTWTETHTPPAWLHPLALLGSRTLLRLGSLRALRWDHVDLKARVLRLPGSIVKTRDPIEVPLAQDALGMLRTLDEANRSATPSSLLVFPNLPDSRAVARAITRAAKRAGIKGRVAFHSLRRSGATILLRQGVPLEVVQRLGGWRSPAVLLKHYRAVDPAELQAAVERLARPDVGSYAGGPDCS